MTGDRVRKVRISVEPDGDGGYRLVWYSPPVVLALTLDAEQADWLATSIDGFLAVGQLDLVASGPHLEVDPGVYLALLVTKAGEVDIVCQGQAYAGVSVPWETAGLLSEALRAGEQGR